MYKKIPVLDPQKIKIFNAKTLGNESPYTEKHQAVIAQDKCQHAYQQITQWAGYEVTPLHHLSGLAKQLKLSAIHYKDESCRFNLGSFKALGGAYAVAQLLLSEVRQSCGDNSIELNDLQKERFRSLLKNITVTSATDGNHGRSVAWGAQQFGCQCVIFIHKEVSVGREKALEALGAHVIRVSGNYDDSVDACDEQATKNHWFIISDTSYEGYTKVPRNVMEGYTVLVDECINQLAQPPTHVIVQGGVGGLPAAVFGRLRLAYKDSPRFIVVEPEFADCLYKSGKANKVVRVDVQQESMMAGLSCGSPSILAWDILGDCVHDFMTIPDDYIAPVMRYLADPLTIDPPIVAGETAAPAIALLMAIAQSAEMGASLGLDEHSRVLVIGTEGATDETIYQSIVGRSSTGIAEATDVVRLTQTLVRQPSLSGEEGDVIQAAWAQMEGLGFRMHKDSFGSIYGLIGPENTPIALLFDGHADVVPALGAWSVEPFGGEIKNGRLYGRGSADMKGGIAAAMIAAMRAHRGGKLKQQICVSFSVLEEVVEGVALQNILKTVQPEHVFICEPSKNLLKTAQRGRIEVELTLYGQTAHAATPEEGVSALLLAAQVLPALQTIEMVEHPTMGKGILVATDITSDPYPCQSMLPSSVCIRFDRRTVAGEDETLVKQQIADKLSELGIDNFEIKIPSSPVKTYTGVTIHQSKSFPAWETNTDQPLVQKAIDALESIEMNAQPGFWKFCTNGSMSAGMAGIPTIGLGPGSEEQAHTVDESIDIEQLQQCVAIYTAIIGQCAH